MDLQQMDFEILPQLSPEQQRILQQEHEERLRKFYNSTHDYAIQKWYQALRQFTFKSSSFVLTNIEAFILTSIYHEEQHILSKPQISSAMHLLIKKVDNFINNNFPGGCFMKLSTRSPKDAGWRYKNEEDISQHVQKLVNLLEGTASLDKKAKNKIYSYFLEKSKDKIKICSGKDFIEIFAHSERIQIDINDLALLNNHAFKKLAQGDYSTAFQKLIDVWGRQWVDCKWMEQFRCFFYNYKLTAICQYDQRCFFQQLKGKQQLIINKISTFFNSLCPKLQEISMSKGVMDVIVKMGQEQNVILIQINIFDHNSRASLFSWDKDLHLLQNGPLELRQLSQQKDISKFELIKMMGMVQKGIEDVLNQVMKRLNLSHQWQIAQ